MRARLALCALALTLAGCADSGDRARAVFLAHAYAQLSGDYARLAVTAENSRDAVQRFCAAPTAEALSSARESFFSTALAFARVEWLRRGPIVRAHRYERLFYWPDRGGRGRRQLVRFIASDDLADIDAGALAEKSVALQGLPALEYLLLSDALTTAATPDSDTCRFAALVAERVAVTARALNDDWQAAEEMRAALAGPEEDPLAQDRALSIVLQSAGLALETAADQKIAPAAGDGPERARPGLAPLALTGRTVPAMAATVGAVTDLFTGPFQATLPDESRYAGEALLRELEQAAFHLGVLNTAGSWSELLADASHHRRLLYVRQPLLAAKQQLDQSLSQALGLVQGFNSADGD